MEVPLLTVILDVGAVGAIAGGFGALAYWDLLPKQFTENSSLRVNRDMTSKRAFPSRNQALPQRAYSWTRR